MFKPVLGLIFHMSHLLVDDSYEMPSVIISKNEERRYKVVPAAVVTDFKG